MSIDKLKIDGRIVQPDPKKWRMCLMEKGTGTIIFALPKSSDQAEVEGALEEQIVTRLVQFSNMFQNYNRAIDEVQGYLRALCNHCPKDKPWIVKIADKAGARFLTIVDEAKKRALRTTIERGEMFLKVKKIDGGKKT